MTEAETTNAAVIAMRRPSVRMKVSSGDIFIFFVMPALVPGHPRRSSLEIRRQTWMARVKPWPGRRRIHTRFIDTETFGPFLMVW